MKRNIKKIFMAWQQEKEEQWLNKMSALGLQLTSVRYNLFFCTYTFDEVQNARYTYKLELLDNLPSDAKSVAYIRFVEEMGIEQVASVMRWVYFRKNAADGAFELYSDNASKIKYYTRIIQMLLCLSVAILGTIPAVINAIVMFHNPVAAVFAAAQALVIIMLATGCVDIYKKISKLKNEQVLRE